MSKWLNPINIKRVIRLYQKSDSSLFMNNPKLLSFDCQWAKNEPRNAVNSAFLGSCTLFKLRRSKSFFDVKLLKIRHFFYFISVTVLRIFCRFGCKRYQKGIKTQKSLKPSIFNLVSSLEKSGFVAQPLSHYGSIQTQ